MNNLIDIYPTQRKFPVVTGANKDLLEAWSSKNAEAADSFNGSDYGRFGSGYNKKFVELGLGMG